MTAISIYIFFTYIKIYSKKYKFSILFDIFLFRYRNKH